LGHFFDPFWSNRSYFNGLHWFLLLIGLKLFSILDNLYCLTCFLRIPIIFPHLGLCLVRLQSSCLCKSVQVYPAVFLIYFISAAVILHHLP
jgi:hypothetical protein